MYSDNSIHLTKNGSSTRYFLGYRLLPRNDIFIILQLYVKYHDEPICTICKVPSQIFISVSFCNFVSFDRDGREFINVDDL